MVKDQSNIVIKCLFMVKVAMNQTEQLSAIPSETRI